jgi:signal recognition particle receptor subunit beta
MSNFVKFVETIMTPSAPVFILGALIVVLVPVLLHILIVKSTPYTALPSVLLVGSSGSGKTSLLTLFERGDTPSATHTTQRSHSVEFTASTDSASKASFRNKNDASGTHTKFLLIDTPGHGKLRQDAMSRLSTPKASSDGSKLKAVVFIVDAAAIGEQDSLAETTSYLYDVLLALQKRASLSKTSKSPGAVSVLIAANKMDLFTALPATIVKTNLETELARIRSSRSKGLLDSGVGIDDVGSEEHDDWLGEYGSEKFSFSQMREFDIEVEVIGGNASGDGPGADKWWAWIASRI